MKYLAILLTVSVVFGCKVQENLQTAPIDDLVQIITNVNVFTGQEYIQNTNFIFNNSRVVDITSDIDPYRNVELVDGTNKTIIPPLGNAHVHLWFPMSLKTSLQAGIFANFDMHNSDETSNNIRSYKDSINYANYYSSNAAATVPGGHGTQFGIAVPTINDSISPEQFVQDRINANAEYIKVIKEPRYNTLTDDQTLRVINESHRNGLLAVGHSHNIKETIVLVDQKIDGIVHIWFDKPANQAQLNKMKETGVFLVPTLLVTKKLLELGQSQGWSEQTLNIAELLNEVKKAHDAGIRILCGTDSPNFGLNYSESLFEEMELLSEAGLSNTDVLKAATINIYQSFKLEHFGELKTGTAANFVLVEGDPMKEIKDIRNAKTVYREGNVIRNEML